MGTHASSADPGLELLASCNHNNNYYVKYACIIMNEMQIIVRLGEVCTL